MVAGKTIHIYDLWQFQKNRPKKMKFFCFLLQTHKTRRCLTSVHMKMQSPQAISLCCLTSGTKTISTLVKHRLKQLRIAHQIYRIHVRFYHWRFAVYRQFNLGDRAVAFYFISCFCCTLSACELLVIQHLPGFSLRSTPGCDNSPLQGGNREHLTGVFELRTVKCF